MRKILFCVLLGSCLPPMPKAESRSAVVIDKYIVQPTYGESERNVLIFKDEDGVVRKLKLYSSDENDYYKVNVGDTVTITVFQGYVKSFY